MQRLLNEAMSVACVIGFRKRCEGGKALGGQSTASLGMPSVLPRNSCSINLERVGPSSAAEHRKLASSPKVGIKLVSADVYGPSLSVALAHSLISIVSVFPNCRVSRSSSAKMRLARKGSRLWLPTTGRLMLHAAAPSSAQASRP